MHTAKLLGKVFTISVLLCAKSMSATPEDSQKTMPGNFEQTSPIANNLSLDFTRLIHGQITKTVGVSFWRNPGKPEGSQVVEAHNIEESCFEIKCDWEHRTAAVKNCTLVNGKKAEDSLEYKITTHDKVNVVLMRVDENGWVDVIMMSGYTGAFMQSLSYSVQNIPDLGARIGYGACWN